MLNSIKTNKANLPLGLILGLFCLIFCSISLVNHYNFRTSAFDLGIYNNAIYDYAHFRWNDSMIMQPQFKNVLSDHFEPSLIIFSPLYYILGTYTLLIVQIGLILAGGYGFYLLALRKTANNTLSLILLCYFFSIWGIYSALSFDYHNNVAAAMMVPWFIYYFEDKNWKLASVFFIFIILSKENMTLWAFFISIGLIILNIKNKAKVIAGLLYAFVGIASFLLIVKFIMPSLANEGRQYLHFNFEALGKDMGTAIETIIKRPVYTFCLLFKNHLDNTFANGIKSELHFMVLLSGGFFLLYRPAFFIMLVSIYSQKLFNNDYVKWGINNQYSIEFVPILAICTLYCLADIKNPSKAIKIAVAIFTICMLANINSIDHRVSKWYNSTNTRFYSKQHYISSCNVSEVNAELNALIPANANVSAQSMLVPHLAFRDKIYQYPMVNDAEYIVLLDIKNPYPLNDSTYSAALTTLKADSTFTRLSTKVPLYIFKKNAKR